MAPALAVELWENPSSLREILLQRRLLAHKLVRIVIVYRAQQRWREGLDTELQAEGIFVRPRVLLAIFSAQGNTPEGLCLTWPGEGCRLLLCLQ